MLWPHPQFWLHVLGSWRVVIGGGDEQSNLEDLWYVTGSHIRIHSAFLWQILSLSLSVYLTDTHKHTIKYGLCHRLHDVKSWAESLGSLTNHKQLIEHGTLNNITMLPPLVLKSDVLLCAKHPSTLVVSQCLCPLGILLLPSCLCFFLSLSLSSFFPFTVCPIHSFLFLFLLLFWFCTTPLFLYTPLPLCAQTL